MDLAAVMVTTQSPVPLQPDPLQPEKKELPSAAAVRVMTVPSGKLSLQLLVHKIPAGSLVTVQLPVPSRVAISVKYSVS